MTCALCRERTADKKNTHYLTDGIIRTCLNLDGSKNREKGFHFGFSTYSPYVEFNFQRETPIQKVEAALGREVTEKEIEKAKKNRYTVDYVFCSTCENNFSEIENNFISKILPKFRNNDLTNLDRIFLDEIKIVRLFFYMQIWRTAICNNNFTISVDVTENLRHIILNYMTIMENDINHYPLAITYLQTLGDQAEYTSNSVSITNDRNPNLIFMNDFVIQFFENSESVRYFDFYGLTTQQNFKELINAGEQEFVINIFQNEKRKQLINDFAKADYVKKAIMYYKYGFIISWFYHFGVYPSYQTIYEYFQELSKDNELYLLHYTKENVEKLTEQFIIKKMVKYTIEKK